MLFQALCLLPQGLSLAVDYAFPAPQMAEFRKSPKLEEFDYEYFYDEIDNTPTFEYPEIFNEEGKKSQALPFIATDNKKYVLRKILRKRRKLSEKISSVG